VSKSKYSSWHSTVSAQGFSRNCPIPALHSLIICFTVTALDGIFEQAEKEGKQVTIENIFKGADVEDILWEARAGNKKLIALCVRKILIHALILIF